MRAFLRVRISPSVRVTTIPHVRCAANHRVVEIRSRLGFPLLFRPSATPFSLSASPRVIFPASFRKSGVGVTPLVAAITAWMPCPQEHVPEHGGQLAWDRLHPRQQTLSASEIGQDLSIGWRQHVWFLLLRPQLSEVMEGRLRLIRSPSVSLMVLVLRGVKEAFHPFCSSQHSEC